MSPFLHLTDFQRLFPFYIFTKLREGGVNRNGSTETLATKNLGYSYTVYTCNLTCISDQGATATSW